MLSNGGSSCMHQGCPSSIWPGLNGFWEKPWDRKVKDTEDIWGVKESFKASSPLESLQRILAEIFNAEFLNSISRLMESPVVFFSTPWSYFLKINSTFYWYTFCNILQNIFSNIVTVQMLSHVWLWNPWMQHARLLSPPLSSRICSNSCPLNQWCCRTISSSASPFTICLQSFPESGAFPMS